MDAEKNLLLKLIETAPANEIELLLREKIDWRFFLRTAEKHRIVPLVFEDLRRFSAILPQSFFVDLVNRARRCAMHNLNFNFQILKISEIFEKSNIEFLAYKGSTLAQIAYGDLSLRQFGDLDILIRKKDFPEVKRIILANGGNSLWELSEKQENAVLKYYYEFPFKIGKNPVLVEIHWAFVESFFAFDYNIEEVFRRRRAVSIRGRKIPTISNEDLLLFLCVHGSKHFWKRLSWICDVGKLVAAQPIDWTIVLRLAEKNGSRRMLNLGLSLAKDFLKIELPDQINQEIKSDREVESLAAELKKYLFDDSFSSETVRPQIHLKMRERWRDKFAYSHRLLTTKLIDSLFMPMGRPQ